MSDNKYDYVTAVICEGQLSLRYRVKGLTVNGADVHDEDVSDWTDNDITDLVKSMLDIPDEQAHVIEIEWV